jgi:hypothetical protein
MKLLPLVLILLTAAPLCAQHAPLEFHPKDTTAGYHGYTPLRLLPLPKGKAWTGAADDGRGIFALHSYAVPYWGPTRDRANEAVLIGWNPMGRLQPEQPGFWWQYEWGYGQKSGPLFELNLDVRDSATLGQKPGLRRISYKMERETGKGISADFAFNNVSFVRGSHSAGDKLRGNYLQISPRSNRMRANLNAEFGGLVQYSVSAHSSADARLFLPLERGTMFSGRLIPLYGAISDSTSIMLNDMQPGVHYTLKIRNEREYTVRLDWNPTSGRTLFWDTMHASPDAIDSGETLVVRIIMDDGLHAFGTIHGRFRETD